MLSIQSRTAYHPHSTTTVSSIPRSRTSSADHAAAVAACKSALRALVGSLRDRGVSGLGEATTQQQQRQASGDYYRTLQQMHDYCRMITSMQNDNAAVDGDDEVLSLLLLSCWQAVGRFTALEYTTAWEEYQRGRHYGGSASCGSLQQVQQRAERCSDCQRQVLILERRQRRHRAASL